MLAGEMVPAVLHSFMQAAGVGCLAWLGMVCARMLGAVFLTGNESTGFIFGCGRIYDIIRNIKKKRG